MPQPGGCVDTLAVAEITLDEMFVGMFGVHFSSFVFSVATLAMLAGFAQIVGERRRIAPTKGFDQNISNIIQDIENRLFLDRINMKQREEGDTSIEMVVTAKQICDVLDEKAKLATDAHKANLTDLINAIRKVRTQWFRDILRRNPMEHKHTDAMTNLAVQADRMVEKYDIKEDYLIPEYVRPDDDDEVVVLDSDVSCPVSDA